MNCIRPEVLLRRLVRELNRRLDAELKHETAKWAAHYEHRLQEGQKPIIHLEGFVAQFMATYKKYLISHPSGETPRGVGGGEVRIARARLL